MHPNPVYRKTPDARSVAFVRERGFGTLAMNGDEGPLLSHIPFLLSDDATSAELHLVRSNPIARTDLPQKAVISVTGADGYVSPDWYQADDQVPTWNYVSVHLRGTLNPLPQKKLRDVLARISESNEKRLSGKTPWTMDKMSDDALDRMLRQIQPFQFRITRLDATWKLSQNKPDTVRLNAAREINTGIGSELDELARLMGSVEKL